jgi:hypothetical protein
MRFTFKFARSKAFWSILQLVLCGLASVAVGYLGMSDLLCVEFGGSKKSFGYFAWNFKRCALFRVKSRFSSVSLMTKVPKL